MLYPGAIGINSIAGNGERKDHLTRRQKQTNISNKGTCKQSIAVTNARYVINTI